MMNAALLRGRSRRARPAVAGALLLIVAATVLAGQPEAGQGAADAAGVAAPVWHGLPAGRALAAEQDRPLMIHFTADWCKWCKVMQRDTYGHPEVLVLLQRSFVTAKVDTERQPRLAAEYGVQGLPTIWFLSAAGEPITYIPGHVEAPVFLQVLRWIESGSYREQPFEEFARAGAP